MKQLLQVKQFHEKFGIPILESPTIPADRIRLRHDILQEEVNELLSACENGDLNKVADGLIDCLYVLLGTSLEFGLHHKLELLFDEVHRSNMSKLDENGNVVKREDGKILKSKLFSPPNIETILTNS